jgi:hypothetical protein
VNVVLVTLAVAAAAVALIANVVLLEQASPRHDRVGRLDPGSTLVRPAPARPPALPRSEDELPDD